MMCDRFKMFPDIHFVLSSFSGSICFFFKDLVLFFFPCPVMLPSTPSYTAILLGAMIPVCSLDCSSFSCTVRVSSDFSVATQDSIPYPSAALEMPVSAAPSAYSWQHRGKESSPTLPGVFCISFHSTSFPRAGYNSLSEASRHSVRDRTDPDNHRTGVQDSQFFDRM